MPAKKVITKNQILQTAFQIAREEGMDKVNVRAIAKRCNCSTQPIYLSFASIADIKRELDNLIIEEFNKYTFGEKDKGDYTGYKAAGMGYIKFACKEKNLFKYLMMQPRIFDNGLKEKTYDKAVGIIMTDYGFKHATSDKLHAEMWVFVHGIATMYATGFMDWNEKDVSEMLTDVFVGLTSKIRSK